MTQKLPVVAHIGDTLICPACGVRLYLDEHNGWRNDGAGYTCNPPRTTHTDHIETVIA